jgi:hypothetical protein
MSTQTFELTRLSVLKVRMYMGNNLELVHHDSFDRYEELYGYKCWFLHRVDLHEGLRSLAVDSSTMGVPATITLDSEVIEIDCENGELTLATGKKVQKDLLVVADGAHVSNPALCGLARRLQAERSSVASSEKSLGKKCRCKKQDDLVSGP